MFMSMKLMMYTSVAVIQQNATGTPVGLSSVVSMCRKNNPIYDVTGALYYRDGRYLQIVEGQSDRVDRLMKNVLNDERHKECIVQLNMGIKKRIFPKWQCQLNISLARDLYLRQFLVNYKTELKRMNDKEKAAFNFFFTQKPSEYSGETAVESVNVFGNEMIHITTQDILDRGFSPLMTQLCDLLINQPHSVRQLLEKVGEGRREQVLTSLKNLNNHGYLLFSDDQASNH